MKKLNLIFDLDGTLVDSIPGIESSLREALLALTNIREIPELRNQIGPPIGTILSNLFPDMDRDSLAMVESKFRKIYNETGWEQSIPYQGVTGLLERLHRQQDSLFVATNKPLLPTRKILAHTGLLPLFTDILCPDSLSPSYSSKADLLRGLMRIHALTKEATVYIGDQPGDQSAAADCDILFVGVTYGYGDLFGFRSQNCILANNTVELKEVFQRIRTSHE